MMQPRLGIIAGGGALPAILIKNCEREGRNYLVIALQGQTAPEVVSGRPHKWVRIGAGGQTLAYLSENNISELVLVGSIVKPALSELRPDAWTTKFLAGNIYSLGDDNLLRRLVKHLEDKEGFRVVGVDELIPKLITPARCLTRASPSESDLADIKAGVEAAKQLGYQDRGQGVIVDGGLIIAREGQAGTDAMINTIPPLSTNQKPRGILVKVIKPEQERRADLPTIGPETIDAVVRSGLRGISIEAGGSLILNKHELLKRADSAGVFVVGTDFSSFEEPTLWPLVYLIAGEPSADNLGAHLMSALKKATNEKIRFAGVGGPAMIAEGLVSLFPMEELSVMGLAEVLSKVIALQRRILQTKANILQVEPDVVIGIDSPDFNLRVAKKLIGKGITLMHFVAPSVWAWRPRRAAKIARTIDHLMTLLPFEPPYFEKFGLKTTYVGHPVLESGANHGDGVAFRERYRIDEKESVILLLFGSRRTEIDQHIPAFLETISLLRQKFDGFRVITVTSPYSRDIISKATKAWPCDIILISDPAQKFDAFAASDVSLAASGTVALELAMAMVPSIIAYRTNLFTAWFIKRLVNISFANLVNLTVEREVVPEFLFDRCQANLMAPALQNLLISDQARIQQREGYTEALEKLGKGGVAASRHAALTIIDVIKNIDLKTQKTSDKK